jgi:hypothetical protein
MSTYQLGHSYQPMSSCQPCMLVRAGTLLLEPRQRIEPARARSSQPKSSTRREPSHFEAIEAQAAQRSWAVSQCTKCGVVGHTRESKACPLRYSELLDAMEATNAPVAPEASYESPQAIYQRYISARSAWYATQPRGDIRTNQQYRSAMGLPLRYSKASYEWCLNYKQMGKRCGSRDWRKEEMMAYLDWSKAEDARIDAQMEIARLRSNRRGMQDIWDMASEGCWRSRGLSIQLGSNSNSTSNSNRNN